MLTSTGRDATETEILIAGVSDPSGDALFKPLGGTNVPAADITRVGLTSAGDGLHVRVTTAGGPLGNAAAAANGGCFVGRQDPRGLQDAPVHLFRG